MNRKEAHKHKKRKGWKTWLVVGAFIAVFVSVLVAFLFALAGKDFGGIFGNQNYWLTIGVANGVVLPLPVVPTISACSWLVDIISTSFFFFSAPITMQGRKVLRLRRSVLIL